MTSAQQIPVTPSVRLAVLLCAAHVAAAGAVWAVPVPVMVKAALIIAITVSLIFSLARHAALHAADAIVALEIRDRGAISLRTRKGEWLECDLLGSSFVSRHLTIVSLRPRNRRRARHVILMPDNLEARDFRRLRMWLRWEGQRNILPGRVEPQ